MNVQAPASTTAPGGSIPTTGAPDDKEHRLHHPEESRGLLPIELTNGCSEEGCHIDSDDANLTNAIHRHYLQHFGHRDLDGIVSDYADEGAAVMWNVVNGECKRYQGHEEIRTAFEEIFDLHPANGASTFHLRQVLVRDRNAMAVWSARTPASDSPHSSDAFRFDENGKIETQFFACAINPLEGKKIEV